MRASVKGWIERVLQAAVRARGLPRGRVLVLAYHDVVPHGESVGGDRSLHLPQTAFAEQLDLLAERVRVVPLAEVLERPDDPEPRAVITWDDAYRGAVTVGIGEVVRRQLPATMFVAPGMLGGRTFWWDALAGADGLDPEIRRIALDQGRGDQDRVAALARDRGWPWRDLGGAAVTATEAELLEAARQPGITLGAHSWSHPNLDRVAPERLAEELARSRDWVDSRAPAPVRWLAYPYGLAGAAVVAATANAGFAGALRIDGGWWRPGGPGPHQVPRQNVPAGLSRAGFDLRLHGLFAG